MPLRRLLGTLLLLACTDVLADLRLELDAHGLSPEQRQASQALLDEARAALPPSFIERLDRRVHVEWREDLPADGYGRATRLDTLSLNARWLPALADGSAAAQPTGRPHRTLRRELLATVVHELTHLYDRARLWDTATARLLQRCRRDARSQGGIGLDERCLGETGRRFTLSDDPRLLDLAGWQQAVGEQGAREGRNEQNLRSPDRYELSNPREFVAVNMEYFLLDPSYACRRPSLQRFFAAHFGWSPPQARACPKEYAFLNAGRNFNRQPLTRLDPARVYAVDYLFAEGNDAWASRWGHAMLRLVICAPDHPRGPACRLDLDQHLVLSYRAFVDDVQLSSWRGLTGSYPSRLFVLPLSQVIDEYTKVELRSLASLPLRLSRAEAERLVQRAAELHWGYDGRYYFISNNCAVETLKLLRSGTGRAEFQGLDSIMPNALLASLNGRGLADTSVLDEPQQALRLGYRFDSFRERYQAMFAVLAQALPVPQKQVEDWLAADADARRRWFDRADLRTSAALLLLEQAALRKQLLLAQEDLKQRYLSGRSQADGAAHWDKADGVLRSILDQSGFLSRPAELLEGGYGLPQPEEWAQLERRSRERQLGLRRLNEQLDEDLRRLLLPERRVQIETTEANVEQLSRQLRALNKAAGGLELP